MIRPEIKLINQFYHFYGWRLGYNSFDPDILIFMSLETAASDIRELNQQRAALIAIDGFGGAGKTTIAEKLAELLGSARIVHMDDSYR